MSVPIKCECPKCHADRTMLDACFGVPGYIHPSAQKDAGGASINVNCGVPVHLILCPRCHYLEMYHDVGPCKLAQP
jgi:hypothetical protein